MRCKVLVWACRASSRYAGHSLVHWHAQVAACLLAIGSPSVVELRECIGSTSRWGLLHCSRLPPPPGMVPRVSQQT